MLRNYFKVALRNLERNKAYALINVICLALGITCAVLIFTLVTYHLSFDTFHSKKDRIYRITTEFHLDGISREANVPQPMGKAFSSDYTFAEKISMVYSRPNWLVSVPSSTDNIKFEETIAFAEAELFEILELDHPLQQRNAALDCHE